MNNLGLQIKILNVDHITELGYRLIKVIFFVCFFNLSWLWFLWSFLSDFIPCHLYLCFLYLRWIPFMITTLVIFFFIEVFNLYMLLSMNAFLFIFQVCCFYCSTNQISSWLSGMAKGLKIWEVSIYVAGIICSLWLK